jgi:putative selenate reductase
MAELVPYPFGALASRMLRELEQQRSIFDLPERKFFLGDRERSFEVGFHQHTAATPLGPAAGPHSQMAQNLVLAWLGGCRVFELKTVQILDELEIPRPCIDMETVGYNVEWSQELKLEQSLDEYVKGAMLIRILEEVLPLAPGYRPAVFDMSVGYDLEGIKTERVQAFIRGMRDASHVVTRLRRELGAELSKYRDLDYATRLSDTLTLSTFHGCPPDEIERITDFLLESGIHSIVKLNPMLLGPVEMRRLLKEVMGYADIHVPDSAFERDTSWQQAVDFSGRLLEKARGLGLGFGVKFSNTLIVENHRSFFTPDQKEMYLSGPPLHVLAMNLVARFRREFGSSIPISFSAGIDQKNFPDAVALGLVPVTVCSDLLKKGGYGRASGYFMELGKRMKAVGASDVPGFILRAHGKAAEALDKLDLDADGRERALTSLDDGGALDADTLSAWAEQTALLNTEAYVGALENDPRYHAAQNSKGPKRIDSKLVLFDCVTCDICVPVCPNDANFTFTPPERELPIVKAEQSGGAWSVRREGTLALKKRHQIATFADFCNECGNCDVFCPEEGAPYVLKPRFFGRRADYERFSDHDGFCLEVVDGTERVLGRFPEGEFVAELTDGRARYAGKDFALRFDPNDLEGTLEGEASGKVDLTFFYIMDLLRRSLLHSAEANYVAALARSTADAR